MRGAISLQALGSLAIVLVVATIIISFGAQILGQIRADQLVIATASITNETALANTSATTTLAHTRIVTNSDTVTNMTDAFTRATDYNITYATGVLTWYNTDYDESNVNVSYQYQYDTFPTEHNVTVKGQETMKTFGDWLPTIALVLVAAIIIGIVLTYLGKRRELGGFG